MRRAPLVCGLAAFFVLAHPPAALAQDDADEGAVEAPHETDAGDLWRLLRHKDVGPGDATPDSTKPFFVAAPTVTTKPSTGLTGGLSSNIAFVTGDPSTTHLSSASASLRVSVRQQTLSSVRLAAFTPDDRWFVQSDTRLWWTSLDTYALGNSSPSTATNLKYDWFRVYGTAYRQVGPRLFVGAGLNVNDHDDIRQGNGAPIDRSAFASYSAQHGFAPDRQVSSGTNLAVLFDTRDNAINAQRGWFASATYRTFFGKFLGGASTWQELNVDARTYRPLTRDGRRKLAFWALGDFVTGGTAPYLDLPSTGGDPYGRSARGYADGRFRGPHLLYGEVEYRETLVPSGLLGMVAFFNTTTLDGDQAGQRLFHDFEPAGGTGLRVLLNKHSRTNLCADYGWGRDGSRGLYLAIQEAF